MRRLLHHSYSTNGVRPFWMRPFWMLVRRLHIPTLEGEAFDAALEQVVNLAETWRRLLADFRPVAKAAAERTDGVPQFGANGFVQV